ncbi:MAG TPA: hypothetical protein V6D26_29365 [Stenomitos sp.]
MLHRNATSYQPLYIYWPNPDGQDTYPQNQRLPINVMMYMD